MTRLPTIFLSHGTPDLILHDLPVRRFFDDFAGTFPRPEAILVASAHYESVTPTVTAMQEPRTIHDFGGFDARLYHTHYRAPGDPDVAERIVDSLQTAGYDATADADWGLDHGAWIPLIRIYPDADIPVLELSINLSGDAPYHAAVGRALAGLRDQGVLVIGSGSFSHNLGELRSPAGNTQAPTWVEAFVDWTAEKITSSDEEALLDYRGAAPYAKENHPTEEHFMPLFIAMGAAGQGWSAERLHHSFTYGALAMDAFRFD